MSTKQPSTGAELDPTEWDFTIDKVPKAELEACYIYEYARELTKLTPRILDLFAQWIAGRKAKRKARRFWKALEVYRKFRQIMTACFGDFPFINGEWFPDTPWQQLDVDVRSRLVKEVKSGPEHYWHSMPRHKLCIEMFEWEKRIGNGKRVNGFAIEWKNVLEPFKDEDKAQTDHASLRINWHYTDAQLKQAFADWLSEQRKNREKRGLGEIKYKPKGRGSFRDQLNWLGALRVKQYYPRKQLVDYPHQKLKVAARPYWNLPDLYEAAKKARKLVDGLLRVADRS